MCIMDNSDTSNWPLHIFIGLSPATAEQSYVHVMHQTFADLVQ